MNLRTLLDEIRGDGVLSVVEREVDPRLEMPRVIHALEEAPVLFERVRGSAFPVLAGLCSSRASIARGLGVRVEELVPGLLGALRRPTVPRVVESAPCQEVVEPEVRLDRLPINTHFPQDGGPYVTAGVAVIEDPDLGRNICYHRLQLLDDRRFAVRIVEDRGTHVAWSKSPDDLPMAVCIGNSMPVLVAAAMSPEPGIDELAIANTLAPTPVVRCKTLDLEVPSDVEMVLEGRLTHHLVEEGPFVDLTETRDIVRMQPVFEVDCVTRRHDALYQTLLPGGREHKLLMGLPREPSIFEAVDRVCRCLNVSMTEGGGHWLHAIVQIAKRHPDDGPRAIAAAFRGHSSLKHVVIVGEDVDPFDLQAVELAIATRCQADRDFIVLRDQPSSSLDPSARHVPGEKSRTAKMGLDATVWWEPSVGRPDRAGYERVRYEPVDLKDYLR
jgi:2,5-furandicarboxylate decarboxylase 1